jgi:hypothetical protein
MTVAVAEDQLSADLAVNTKLFAASVAFPPIVNIVRGSTIHVKQTKRLAMTEFSL